MAVGLGENRALPALLSLCDFADERSRSQRVPFACHAWRWCAHSRGGEGRSLLDRGEVLCTQLRSSPERPQGRETSPQARGWPRELSWAYTGPPYPYGTRLSRCIFVLHGQIRSRIPPTRVRISIVRHSSAPLEMAMFLVADCETNGWKAPVSRSPQLAARGSTRVDAV